MADEEQLKILKQGAQVWNRWREEHPDVRPALSGANLSRADLGGANLFGADLGRANLSRAHLSRANLGETRLLEADFRGADLGGAYLGWADLYKADFSRADLGQAYLKGAALTDAHLDGANLSGANLTEATLVRTDFTDAILTGCSIYGISAWDVKLKGANQSDLIISPEEQPIITVDNLRVAQFIYLLLNNEEIRAVIDTITSKVVLILGRFTPERKAVLDALRNELRRRDYLPILFDFEKPSSRDLTETISTLAHMARFVIADITAARSIPQELERIVPNLPSVPVQSLISRTSRAYGMFEHYTRYPWVLEPYRYRDLKSLLASLAEKVIDPAEQKAKELTGKK
jgi:hypothetical protein